MANRDLTEEQKAERYRAQKKEAQARFKERRERELQDRKAGAAALKKELTEGDWWDDLSDPSRAFIDTLIEGRESRRIATSSGIFRAMFGEEPDVGAEVTLNEAFARTLKGKAALDGVLRKWAAKGIVVSFTENPDNILESVYRLEGLPEVS